MLLRQIVALFDDELEQLNRLREIVVGLAGPSVLELRQPALAETMVEAQDELETVTPPPTEETPRVRKVSAPRQRRAAAPRVKAPAEPTALGGAIPTAPVVVRPEALAQEGVLARRVKAKPVAPAPEPGSLGSMIRALRLDAIP